MDGENQSLPESGRTAQIRVGSPVEFVRALAIRKDVQPDGVIEDLGGPPIVLPIVTPTRTHITVSSESRISPKLNLKNTARSTQLTATLFAAANYLAVGDKRKSEKLVREAEKQIKDINTGGLKGKLAITTSALALAAAACGPRILTPTPVSPPPTPVEVQTAQPPSETATQIPGAVPIESVEKQPKITAGFEVPSQTESNEIVDRFVSKITSLENLPLVLPDKSQISVKHIKVAQEGTSEEYTLLVLPPVEKTDGTIQNEVIFWVTKDISGSLNFREMFKVVSDGVVSWQIAPLGAVGVTKTEAVLWYPNISKEEADKMTDEEFRQLMKVGFAPPTGEQGKLNFDRSKGWGIIITISGPVGPKVVLASFAFPAPVPSAPEAPKPTPAEVLALPEGIGESMSQEEMRSIFDSARRLKGSDGSLIPLTMYDWDTYVEGEDNFPSGYAIVARSPKPNSLGYYFGDIIMPFGGRESGKLGLVTVMWSVDLNESLFVGNIVDGYKVPMSGLVREGYIFEDFLPHLKRGDGVNFLIMAAMSQETRDLAYADNPIQQWKVKSVQVIDLIGDDTREVGRIISGDGKGYDGKALGPIGVVGLIVVGK